MNSTDIKKAKFSGKSSNFVVNILNFVLGALALSGVNLPSDPATITTDLANTLSSTGWVAVVGLVILNIVSPLYHAFKDKTFSLKGILSSSNFWVQAGTLASSLIVLLGIALPTGTAEQIVGAVYAKDWAGLAIVLFTNVLNPLIRWFKDKVAATAAAR